MPEAASAVRRRSTVSHGRCRSRQRERRPVVGQRRAEARGGGERGGHAGDDRDLDARRPCASVRAAMPCTPASPEETSATRARRRARDTASRARVELLAHARRGSPPGRRAGRRTGRRRGRSRSRRRPRAPRAPPPRCGAPGRPGRGRRSNRHHATKRVEAGGEFQPMRAHEALVGEDLAGRRRRRRPGRGRARPRAGTARARTGGRG